MKFFTKCLITFLAIQKKTCLTLAILVAATIISNIRGDLRIYKICFLYCVCLIICILFFLIACFVHRKKRQRFKVYLSFSESRIPYLVRYIDDYLKPAFWIYNIDYYDFREHKRFHYLNEPAICEEINKNLANSDIYVRFIGEGLEPNKVRLIKNQVGNIRFNPFTGSLSSYGDSFTYYDYEVNTSYDNFGFNNPFNRFQIISEGINNSSPMPHIKTIFVNSCESALDFAIRIISEFSYGYWQYKRRNNILR